MCGSGLKEPHCADCMGFGDYLCDYPVGAGKTCDRPLCDEHAHLVAPPDVHYCDGHYAEWKRWREGHGEDRVLENVIPFRGA